MLLTPGITRGLFGLLKFVKNSASNTSQNGMIEATWVQILALKTTPRLPINSAFKFHALIDMISPAPLSVVSEGAMTEHTGIVPVPAGPEHRTSVSDAFESR